MSSFLDYITFCINKLVSILSFRPFSDFPVTYFQFIASIFVISYLFKFIFGGFKELESQTNFMVSRMIDNYSRRKMLSKKKNKKVDNKN